MYILGCRYDDDDDDDDASGVRFTKYSIFGKMAKHEKKIWSKRTYSELDSCILAKS